MGSFPITANNAINALSVIKEFCILVGMPKIIKTDKGLEYWNKMLNEFCYNNNITHIKSLPHYSH